MHAAGYHATNIIKVKNLLDSGVIINNLEAKITPKEILHIKKMLSSVGISLANLLLKL